LEHVLKNYDTFWTKYEDPIKILKQKRRHSKNLNLFYEFKIYLTLL